jgi:hypothetical protein
MGIEAGGIRSEYVQLSRRCRACNQCQRRSGGDKGFREMHDQTPV